MRIDRPRGEVPRSKGCNLPPNYAECAENLNLSAGRFEPWRQPVEQVAFGYPVRRAHTRDGLWVGDARPEARFVDAGVVSPKTYRSVPECRPEVSSCLSEWTWLGYPVPGTPEAVVDPCATVEKGPDTQHVTYLVTYSNNCQEEGPASCPTDAVVIGKDGRVGILLPEPPDRRWGIDFVNIYRSQSLWNSEEGLYNEGASRSAETAMARISAGWTSVNGDQDYFLAATLPISQRTYLDEEGAAIGRLLVTQDFLPPHAGTCVAGETQSGSAVIWKERTVWFSERNQHWAYPVKSAHDFDGCIMDVCICADNVFVLTTTGVVLVSDAIDCQVTSCRPVQELKESPACVARRSCVALQGGVLYSSTTGLVLAGADGSTRLVSSRAFAKDDWSRLGSNVELTIGEGHLVLSTDRQTYLWELAFDESGQLPADLTTFSLCADHWMAGQQEQLYYLDGERVYLFNAGGEYLRMNWLQAEQRSQSKVKLSAIGAEYVKKGTTRLNRIELYRSGRLSTSKALKEGSLRIRGTASDCSQVRIKGSEPMCSVSYGTGLTSLRGESA